MGKLKIKGKKIKAIQPGTVDPVHTIPAVDNEDGEEKINLSIIQGWDKLSIQQQRYLVEFSKRKLKRKRAAIAAGLSTSMITEWEKTQPFARIYQDIIDLHAEGIEEMDYLASYDPKNNTARGRFLSKRSRVYKEDEPTGPAPIGTLNNQTNIFAILNSDETTKKGLAGVQQAFRQLRDKQEVQAED